MAQPEAPRDLQAVESVPIDQAFLDISDDENEAIVDAKKTFTITLISAIAFIAIVFIFVL